jgi:hypothetical protein
MRPWIWPNGQLHVSPCRVEELRRGDIAVWFDGRQLFSHRVVRVEGDTVVTKPDWTRTVDPALTGHQLVGRAVRFSKGSVSYRLDGRLALVAGHAASLVWRALSRIKRALT